MKFDQLLTGKSWLFRIKKANPKKPEGLYPKLGIRLQNQKLSLYIQHPGNPWRTIQLEPVFHGMTEGFVFTSFQLCFNGVTRIHLVVGTATLAQPAHLRPLCRWNAPLSQAKATRQTKGRSNMGVLSVSDHQILGTMFFFHVFSIIWDFTVANCRVDVPHVFKNVNHLDFEAFP